MQSNEAPNRVPVLDYLRGLAALSVLLFHTDKWVSGIWNPGTFLGKCGVYAVALFYILSGLTLTLVYKDTLKLQKQSFLRFAEKRVRRIFPLLWLTTTATLLLEEPLWTIGQIVLNYTGLFGFFDPSGDIALGAWSIGNELVFYTFFPLLLWTASRPPLFWTTFALSLVFGALYAFLWLDPLTPISSQWAVYVQPANHAFLFAGGMAIGLFPALTPRLPVKTGLLLASTVLVLALYFPIGSEPSGLICGLPRVVLSTACFVLVASLYATRLSLPALPHRVLHTLGTLSYGIYLLHPLVFRVLKALNVRSVHYPEGWLIPATLVATLVLSHLSWRYVEKPLLTKGFRSKVG